MIKKQNRRAKTQKRHYRLRRHLKGTATSPRLSVFRSEKHIYAQIIDDESSCTLAAASSVEKEFSERSGANIDGAKIVGTLIAERANEKGIKRIVFDRGGNLYHGRIKALAEAAREGGLAF